MGDGKLHSKISASSMHRWMQCAGSVRMSEGIESVSSAYANEGTKAHEIAALVLSGNRPKEFCDVAPEMMEAIDLYVNTVMGEANGDPIQVEVKFDLSSVYPGLFGTADAVVYDSTKKLLRVYDFKYGQGILVEVQDNPQLKYYGLGALISTGSPCREVELVIVQPRASHPDGVVRRWRTSAFNMVEFAADLESFAAATAAPNAPLNPGDHCRFCPAAGICPALSRKALAVAQTEFKPALSYDPVVLAETLKKVDLLEDYAKSVRAFAYQEAEHGRCPPGWKLVAKRATRKWKSQDDSHMGLALSSTFKIHENDLYEKPSLKSPAQVEKLLTKEQKKIINDFTVNVSSGLVLVEETDSRPAALTGPVTEFKVIENDETEKLFN